MKAVGNRLVDDVTKLNTTFISKLNDHALIDSAWYFNGAIYGKTTSGKRLTFDIHDDIDAIIAKADDSSKNSCIPFMVDNKIVGTVPPNVVKELKNYPDVFEISGQNEATRAECVMLASRLSSVEQRDEAIARVLEEIRKKDNFVTLKGWRHELYSVRSHLDEPPLLNMERTACCLFGVVQYGVHINGYTVIDGEVKMWIGKRSATKPTFPSMYDNMCAGGLTGGMGIRDCAMKECQEEASIDDELLKRLKSVDCVSYCYEDERGIFPETQFVFDIELPNDFVPKNADGEMQNFQLLSLDKVKELIMGGNFKPNCALCVVNYLIRHGYITPDDESIQSVP